MTGGGFTLAAHLLTIGIPAMLALWLAVPDNAYDEDRTWFFLYGSLMRQLLVLLAAVIVGSTLASYRPRRRRSVVGWAVGAVAVPFVWTGVWISLIHRHGNPLFLLELIRLIPGSGHG